MSLIFSFAPSLPFFSIPLNCQLLIYVIRLGQHCLVALSSLVSDYFSLSLGLLITVILFIHIAATGCAFQYPGLHSLYLLSSREHAPHFSQLLISWSLFKSHFQQLQALHNVNFSASNSSFTISKFFILSCTLLYSHIRNPSSLVPTWHYFYYYPHLPPVPNSLIILLCQLTLQG